MARRVRLELDKKWREKISHSVLVNRLMRHAKGEIEMTSTQLKAAEILLRKVLPDLKSTEMVVKDHREPTKAELEAELRSYGIEPEALNGPKH